MASFRQKPSGAWEARYRDATGRLHSRTLRTKTEARRWAAEREADLRRGEWVDPRLARVTFAEWAADYLTTIVHLRNVTRGDYQRVLDGHLLPAFANRPIASIEPIDVRRFMAEKQAAGQAPKSLQKMRLVLRQVLELARESGAIKSNPCDGLRLPRAVQMEPIFLRADEVERLAQATRSPYDLLVRLVAATGLRPSEACGLRVGRVNLMKGTMEICEALTVVGGRTEVGPTKTYARRTVGIPRSIGDDLAAHLSGRVAALGRPLDPDDYVFTAPRGGPLRRDLLFKRFLRPAIEAANLPSNLRLHDLRHSCAALLIELGAHPKAIQERLGHSSITVTMDVYGHLFPALNEALTDQLDDVFSTARAQPGAQVTGILRALPEA
jgi:integrase